MSWDAGIFFSRGPRVRFGTKYLVSKGCYLAASKWQERIVDLHLEALLVELADFYSDCWANLERAYSFESVIISSKIHGRMCWSLDNYLFMYMFLSPKTARFRWTVFLRLISILTKLEGLRSLLIIRSWLFSPDVSSSRDSVFPQIAIAIKKPCASEKAWNMQKWWWCNIPLENGRLRRSTSTKLLPKTPPLTFPGYIEPCLNPLRFPTPSCVKRVIFCWASLTQTSFKRGAAVANDLGKQIAAGFCMFLLVTCCRWKKKHATIGYTLRIQA